MHSKAEYSALSSTRSQKLYKTNKQCQEDSEHNEVDGMKKGVDSKGEVMHI